MARRINVVIKSCIVVGICALMSSAVVARAATLPEGPIHIIVPTTAGSTPDTVARKISEQLSRRLDHPIIIENKPGGTASSIGTSYVTRAKPDGLTLLLTASTIIGGSSLVKLPYDPITDLTPITLLGWNRLVLVANPKAGFSTIDELISTAKAKPGVLNYGSPGTGTPNHLAAELFKLKAGINMTHVPYRGSAPQITGVIGGQVELAPLSVIAAAPHVKEGSLTALAITGDKRSPLLPDVPALSELGVSGVQGDMWYGLFGPKKMSAETVTYLNTVFTEVLNEQKTYFDQMGFEVSTGTPQAFRDLTVKDSKQWAEVIRIQKIKAD